MTHRLFPLLMLCGLLGAQTTPPKLRIIAIGAHPDDCDIKFAGTAAKLAKAGHAIQQGPELAAGNAEDTRRAPRHGGHDDGTTG